MTTETFEMKDLRDALGHAFESFKKENDKLIEEKGALNAEKVAKLESSLDSLESKYKKLELERSVETKSKEFDEVKAHFHDYMRKGEVKARLLSGDAGQGGYLITPEMENMIVKAVTETDTIRQYARVKTIGKGSLVFPKRGSLLSSNWVGEQGSASDSTSTYSQGEIPTYMLMVNVPVSKDLLADSEFNIEQEISADVAEEFARKEGKGFVTGTAINQPEGFLTNSSVTATDTAGSGVIASDDIIDLMFRLKSAYTTRAAFYGNRLQMARVRKLKGTDNHYLLNMGQGSNGIEWTLLGHQFVETPTMVSTTSTGDKVLAFGDMFSAYTIIDRLGMTVVRDELTLKKENAIEFTFSKRVGGKVVQPEALQVLKIKA